MPCSSCLGIEKQFDQAWAADDLRRYRKRGPMRTTQLLVDALKAEGVEGQTLLDIGGGIGALQNELLKGGMQSVSLPWRELGHGVTDDDGRIGDLLAADHRLAPGVYRLRFDVAVYFRAQGKETFYHGIPITFEIRASGEHYHVPLLLNPFGYTTYRGS